MESLIRKKYGSVNCLERLGLLVSESKDGESSLRPYIIFKSNPPIYYAIVTIFALVKPSCLAGLLKQFRKDCS